MNRIKPLVARAVNELYCGGLTREEFERIKPAIYDKNHGTLLRANALAVALLGVLWLLSIFIPFLEVNRGVYMFFCPCFLLLFVLAWVFIGRRSRKLSIPMTYMMLAVAYAFGIVLGVFSKPEQPATTFCVLLFALPLLLIDRPVRCAVLVTGATACFCVCTVLVKSREISQQDIVNSISFLILGITVNHYVMKTKLRDILNQSIIERERDTDDLTRLLNKAAGRRQMEEYISGGGAAALLILDIDNFKSINDSYGHAYGDTVLRTLGTVIAGSFRSTDVLARIGGDEFAMLLPESTDIDRIGACMDRMDEALKDSFIVNNRFAPVTFSVGAAFCPRDSRDYDTLFEMADRALYAAKNNGKKQLAYYSPELANGCETQISEMTTG